MLSGICVCVGSNNVSLSGSSGRSTKSVTMVLHGNVEPQAPLGERLSFNLNDCSLVSAQQHARPCRENKRDTRQMFTGTLVPSEDDFYASFTDEHSRPRHVCSFVRTRQRPAVDGSLAQCSLALPLISTKVELLNFSLEVVI